MNLLYFQAEIERLRKEGSQQVEEEVELVRQQLLQETKLAATEQPQNNGINRLRIKWKASKDDPNNGGYPYETLLKIMSKVVNSSANTLFFFLIFSLYRLLEKKKKRFISPFWCQLISYFSMVT